MCDLDVCHAAPDVSGNKYMAQQGYILDVSVDPLVVHDVSDGDVVLPTDVPATSYVQSSDIVGDICVEAIANGSDLQFFRFIDTTNNDPSEIPEPITRLPRQPLYWIPSAQDPAKILYEE